MKERDTQSKATLRTFGFFFVEQLGSTYVYAKTITLDGFDGLVWLSPKNNIYKTQKSIIVTYELHLAMLCEMERLK